MDAIPTATMRLTASLLSLLFLCAASFARPNAATPSAPVPPAPDPDAPPSNARADCMTEAYAFASVAALARELGSDATVFDDALDDLRQQLLECLAGPPAGVIAAKLRRRRPRLHD